jgi:Cu+-exporting ATPase
MPNDNTCIHCGADCGKHPDIWKDKAFCCSGCKQVYQLLQEHNLNSYYNYEKNPGIKIEHPESQSKYAFLDRDDIREKLYEFHENNIARVKFYIPSIHCASCIWLLENLNKLNPGIVHSTVNFVKKELTATFRTSEISLRTLVELLVSIHYIPDISAKTIDKKKATSVDRKLMYKIGVAGFVFGNVMLYSLPEYFSGKALEGNLNLFLSYVSFLLTIPVVFYSGSDYIISAWKNLRKGIINIDLPIAIGILTLFAVTSFEIISQTGQGYSDSLAGFLFFLLIGRWYQNKTYQSLSFDRDYESYFPVAVSRLSKNNVEESCLLDEINVGDTLLIRNKELIPADAVLVSGSALIDYSFVSGESVPIRKEKGEPLYAGGIQNGASITIRVEKEVKQSHLTQLWNQSEKKTTSGKSLKSLIDKISVWFTIVIILISLGGFIYWLSIGKLQTAILVFTSILIVACPCALALSMPFSLGNGMRMLGNYGLYLKNAAVIEKLSRINTIVFDKTGTLTKPDENDIEYKGDDLSEEELKAVYSLVSQSAHPLSYALAKSLDENEEQSIKGFVEIQGRGIYAEVSGMKISIGSETYITGEAKSKTDTTSNVFLKINEKVKGTFKINNAYREGLTDAFEHIKQHFDIYLLSGDNSSERRNLQKWFQDNKLFFNQQPADKMKFVQRLKQDGNNVLMTGDGLNDAGAFMESDVALSVADDIYHFSPAGDAILEASNFGKLYSYIRYSQHAMTIVKISFVISFLYNSIGLAFAITGNLTPVVAAVLMPVSSVTVVGFATLSTKILAKKIIE